MIGGYYDTEFMADTRALWRLKEAGVFQFVTSQLVFQEIVRAPERVRTMMPKTFTPDDVLERTKELEKLVQANLI